MSLKDVHVGDKVRVHNINDNAALDAGYYDMDVIDEDSMSFAVKSFGYWWFYRDTGVSYVGNARVVNAL